MNTGVLWTPGHLEEKSVKISTTFLYQIEFYVECAQIIYNPHSQQEEWQRLEVTIMDFYKEWNDENLKLNFMHITLRGVLCESHSSNSGITPQIFEETFVYNF